MALHSGDPPNLKERLQGYVDSSAIQTHIPKCEMLLAPSDMACLEEILIELVARRR